MSSTDRVFERRIVSKRRTAANLEDTPEKQCPNGWASVVAAAAAAASSSSSSFRQKTAAKISQRTTFQPHPDSICDWFFKVSEKHISRLYCIPCIKHSKSSLMILIFAVIYACFTKSMYLNNISLHCNIYYFVMINSYTGWTGKDVSTGCSGHPKKLLK